MSKRIVFVLIALLITGCKTKKKTIETSQNAPDWIIGEWQIIDMSFDHFNHLYCEKLDVGTIMVFDKDNGLSVFNKDSIPICGGLQTYSVNDQKLNVFQYDIGTYYTIEKFGGNLLELNTKEIPPDIISNSKRTNNDLGWEKDSTAIRIERDGITIKLKKNVG